MKSRGVQAKKFAAELDELDAQLAEVRAQARRFAAGHAETERKLADLGRAFERLSARLAIGRRKK